MRVRKLVATVLDDEIAALVARTDKRTLAVWAAECAERVLPYFEDAYPDDARPRRAIEALRVWVRTGVFRMADVRRDSLAAHAAARAATDLAAHSAARAAGQALATAHAAGHAQVAAVYAATAVRNATGSITAVMKERRWQLRRLGRGK